MTALWIFESDNIFESQRTQNLLVPIQELDDTRITMTAYTVMDNRSVRSAAFCVDIIPRARKILPGQAPVPYRAIVFIDDQFAFEDQHIGLRDMPVQRYRVIGRKAKHSVDNLALQINIQHADI